MIKPTKILIALLTAVWVVAFVEIITLSTTNLALPAMLTVLAFAAVDLIMSRKANQNISAIRTLNQTIPLGISQTISVKVTNQGTSKRQLQVHDQYPTKHKSNATDRTLTLQANEHAEFSYTFTPTKRGAFTFGQLAIFITTPFQLWKRRFYCGEESHIKVYPDYSKTIKHGMLSAEHRLNQMGVHKKRQRGEGTNFNQLREFRQGDRLSSIDWKATARMNKIISKEFQQEKDQQVIILLDCSKNMRSKDSELSHFDHTLNATLLLSYIAVKQGDSVGLMTFGGSSRWIKPTKSPKTVNRILEELYDLEPTGLTPDYINMAEKCQAMIKKRALIIVISNARQEESHDLITALKILKQKHFVLFVGLKEQIVEELEKQPINQLKDALDYCATVDFIKQRNKIFEDLRHRNIYSLDVTADKLAHHLVNRYLTIKSQGAL